MPFKPSAKRLLFSSTLFIFCQELYAQTTNEDTIPSTTLQDVRITAFEQNRRLKDIPAPVGYVGRAAMQRFSPASIVHAVNTVAGVRMEDRSPGSYRFNIRGSSLRSPFGVRNVKVYFNDIPFTDPGGHTYLNQLGYYNFNSIEIIKGPGSSLYGAGTGGVLLIESLSNTDKPGSMGEYTAGSFGLQNIYASFTSGNENAITKAGLQHQQSEGYRAHSELKRKVLSWSGRFRLNDKRFLKTTFLYGDLFYETPGALTKAEYEANPRVARPGGFGFPGTEAAKASIRQRTFLAGASYEQEIFSWLRNKSVLYGMFTELRNPTIRNYGKSSEPHAGGRSTFKIQKSFGTTNLNIDAGTEWQQGFTSVDIHRNLNGHPDSLQTHDEINNRQAALFAQVTIDIANRLTLNAGASLNTFKIRFQRFVPGSLGMQEREIKNEIAPRAAVMYRLDKISIYSGISKGFSPPTSAELLPTGGAINFNLNPEDGTSYDVGVKGNWTNHLSFDINAFFFRLNNTIVQRRDAGGGDYFINAGKTDQKGIEAAITYPLFQRLAAVENDLSWVSYTYNRFKYDGFKQLNNDFSGNKLPGVTPHAISAGYDVLFKNGLLGAITYYYNDEMPLNDANSGHAQHFHLLGVKAGYQKIFANKFLLKVFAGVENLLDERYSLGNDINGFGGRYYNAAAGRNYYATLAFHWMQ